MKNRTVPNLPGFFGRTVVSEFMSVSENLRSLIGEAKPASAIRDEALKEGMISFLEDGHLKVKEGITTEKEIQRVAFL